MTAPDPYADAPDTRYLIVAPDEREQYPEDLGFTFACEAMIEHLVQSGRMRPDPEIMAVFESDSWEGAKTVYDAWWDSGLPGYGGPINRALMGL